MFPFYRFTGFSALKFIRHLGRGTTSASRMFAATTAVAAVSARKTCASSLGTLVLLLSVCVCFNFELATRVPMFSARTAATSTFTSILTRPLQAARGSVTYARYVSKYCYSELIL